MSRPLGKPLWWGMIATLTLLALWPRITVSNDIEPGQPQWVERARKFQAAVAQGDWGNTFMAPHPGLTVLWIAGFAELLPRDSSFAARSVAASKAQGTATAVVFLAILLVLERLLRRSGHPAPRAATLVAGALLAFDPTVILTSGLIGLDGLMSMLILLGLLLFVLHGFTRSRASLVGALVTSGLAAATKVAGLTLILAPFLTRIGPAGDSGRPSWRRLALVSAATVIVVALIVALLLPMAWVRPLHAADLLLLGGAQHKESLAVVLTKPRDVYLMGDSEEVKGPQYYLVNLAFRSTPLAILGLLAGLLFARFRSDRIVRQISAFLVLVLIAITLAQQKEWRYMMPLLPMLDVLAGLGLVESARWLSSRVSRPAFATAIPLLLVVSQAGWVATAHPYYELRLNPLFGGPQVAAHAIKLGWTGGYGEAMEFLRAESNRLGRPITWSGGSVKWSKYKPATKPGSKVRWLGRKLKDANGVADCHITHTITSVSGLTNTDKRWRRVGVVSKTIRRLGLDLVTIRCLESRGFRPESAVDR